MTLMRPNISLFPTEIKASPHLLGPILRLIGGGSIQAQGFLFPTMILGQKSKDIIKEHKFEPK